MTTEKKGEIQFGLFWLLLGIFATIYSCTLGLGSIHNPGSGLTPFLFGLLLSGFSAVNLLSHLRTHRDNEKPAGEGALPLRSWKLLIMILSLLAFGVFLEDVGYLITTFVVMAVLFKIADTKWIASVLWSLGVTCITYLLFTHLGVVFPAGIMSFLGWL